MHIFINISKEQFLYSKLLLLIYWLGINFLKQILFWSCKNIQIYFFNFKSSLNKWFLVYWLLRRDLTFYWETFAGLGFLGFLCSLNILLIFRYRSIVIVLITWVFHLLILQVRFLPFAWRILYKLTFLFEVIKIFFLFFFGRKHFLLDFYFSYK